jgi:hypothetical protein
MFPIIEDEDERSVLPHGPSTLRRLSFSPRHGGMALTPFLPIEAARGGAYHFWNCIAVAARRVPAFRLFARPIREKTKERFAQ